jgi:molybdopterin synthase sulfur carrier subunit
MPLIKLYGNLRRWAGVSQAQADGVTVRRVIETLCANNAALRDAILDGDTLRAHVRVMVNGRDAELAQGLDTPVRAGDQIAIFPPIAGG